MLCHELHQTLRRETPNLSVDAPVRAVRCGRKGVYAFPTGACLNQAEQLLELACPTHGKTTVTSYIGHYIPNHG